MKDYVIDIFQKPRRIHDVSSIKSLVFLFLIIFIADLDSGTDFQRLPDSSVGIPGNSSPRIFHKKLQMLISFSCPQPGYCPVRLAYVPSFIYSAKECSIGRMVLDIRGREAAQLTIGFVCKENLPGDRYNNQGSWYGIFTHAPIADLLEHPDMGEHFSFNRFKLVSQTVCQIGFYGGKYILYLSESIEPVPGVIGQERDEALKEFFLVHNGKG